MAYKGKQPFQKLKEKTVTLRERDTTNQIRVKIKDLKEIIHKYVYDNILFKSLGKPIK